MSALEFLATCLEQGAHPIAPMLAEGDECDYLSHLHQIGAVVQTRAEVVICPCCQSHAVRIMAAGSGFCIDCGQVNLRLQDMQRLTPSGDWLRRRIAQALDLAGESAWVMVPDRVWRIGDVGRANERHSVLFGQRLGDVRVLRELLTVWPTHVGERPAIMVTTSAVERVLLPGVRVQLVPLAAAFQVRSTGLVAEEAVWAGIRAPRRGATDAPRHGPFAHDFRDVLLPGEHDPIPLTAGQTALLRVLWEQGGVPLHREALIARANVGVEKPIHAFQKQKYPDANRAYHALVRGDALGRYWIPRSA